MKTTVYDLPTLDRKKNRESKRLFRRFYTRSFSHPKFKIRVRRVLKYSTVLLFFAWAFLTTDSFFLWWLWWSVTGGPAEVDPKLTQNCTIVSQTLPIVIVIPLIAKQIDRLEITLKRWTRKEYFPCINNDNIASRPTLAIYFDRPLTEQKTAAAVSQLEELTSSKEINSVFQTCFKNVIFKSAQLSEEESRNTYSIDLFRNLIRTKGSNAQFEKAFTVFGNGQYRHMFYMEPDTWPIRKNWLDAIVKESSWGDFWVRGTIMRYVPRFNIGWEPFRTRYQRHINGNAIYVLNDPCFERYRTLTRNAYGDGAFDVAMLQYRMALKRISTFQAVQHRFQVTEALMDIAVTASSEETLLKKYSRTYLVHGKRQFVRNPERNFMQY